MLGQSFYHETIRNVIVAFGTMFNNLQIVRKDNSGTVTQIMKVPLAYGPKQKFIARLDQAGDIMDANNSRVAMTLPSIAFDITGLAYDAERKLGKLKQYKLQDSGDNTVLKTQFAPVPYNINFGLYVMAKNTEDALQVVEQILPFFQPDYTITLNDNSSMGTSRDVPIILSGVQYEDSYDGDFNDRRVLTYTMSFTAKFYLYGPVTDQKVIKQVQVDQYTDMPVNAPKREQRYSVTPSPQSAEADDNFGFNETTSFFEDAKNYDEKTGTDTDDA